MHFLKRYQYAAGIGLGLLVANLSYLTHNIIGSVFTLCFILFVPGYLLLRCVAPTIKQWLEIVSLSLGLSLLLLMTSGLLLNSLHAFGLTRPLTTWNIFMAIDAVTLCLLLVNRNAIFPMPRRLPRVSKEQLAILSALTLLPVLAIFGAIRLNNGASNILTMIMFAASAALFLVLAFSKKMRPIYPYAVVMIGLAVLLSTSIRSPYTTGHDIQEEFYVFQLTSKAGYWSMGAARSPYNACLSITILPTIFAKITSIAPPYIYKTIFQPIFAIGLLPIYLLAKKLANESTAFLSSLVFISFPTFFDDMPFLNRQEIAFVFFGLVYLVAFSNIKHRAKIILTILGLTGLILSHYSSSYIILGMLTLSWLFYKPLNFFFRHKKRVDIKLPVLSLPIIILAFLATFLWNAQITSTTSNLSGTLAATFTGILDGSGSQSGDVSYSLIAPATKSPEQLLNSHSGAGTSTLYVPGPNMAVTKLGRIVSNVISPLTLNSAIRSFAAKILQILVVLGLVILLFESYKDPTETNIYFLAVSSSCLVLLVLQTVLPQLSIDYGTLRFFQQTLVILGIPIVLAVRWLFRFIPRSEILVTLFFVFLFLDLSGFVPQILGDYPAQMALNNSGGYYESYYVHKGELLSAQWLVRISDKRPVPVAMDTYAQNRFIQQGLLSDIALYPILSNYNNNSLYTYEDYANVHTGTYQEVIDGTHLRFEFVNGQSESALIYANQDSKIYK